jgi:acetyl esterase/lipase
MSKHSENKTPKTMTKRLFLLVDKVFYNAQNPRKKVPDAVKGLVQVHDIVYDGEGGNKLDILYLPRQDGKPYPVVFEIHGGGFSAGDKTYRLYHCAQIARRTGAMVVNVNHPLGPEVICPKPLQSLVCAFNWVIDHAEEYHMDTRRMLVTGDSSGAYYASLLAMLPDNPVLQQVYGQMKGRFTHAVYICGIYDIADSLAHHLPLGITTGVCRDISGRKPKQLTDWEYLPYISPVDFVTSGHPKALVIYAQKDFFAKGQAETLIGKIRAEGVPCEEYHSTRFIDNHAFPINSNNRVAVQSREMMYDFMCAFAQDVID